MNYNINSLKVQKLYSDTKLPKYAHTREINGITIPEDACMDVFLHNVKFDVNTFNFECYVGFATEFNIDKVLLCVPRSSLTKHDLVLKNSPGVIDAGYRGEIIFKFTPINKLYKRIEESLAKEDNVKPIINLFPYNLGDAIGQIMLLNNNIIDLQVVDKLSPSNRGTGGYGSSDIKPKSIL